MERMNVSRSLSILVLCVFVLICGAVTKASAQNQVGAISGTLTDSAGAVLRGAQVSIPSKGIITYTDQQGNFYFSGLPAGKYTISVTYIGFRRLRKPVEVIPGGVTTVNLQLQVGSQNQTVLVTAGNASAQVQAINEERAANNILQVMPVQTITSLPTPNLGDAIGRMPSVTLTRNEGQAQYVQMRGTQPRLTNTTINGFNMPSGDPGVREFDFSTVPAGIVDSVQVSKTLQANMDGDGIGGSINLVTKTATDTPTYNFSVLGGYTPIQGGRPNTDEYGTWGRRFGAGKKFGAIIGGEYSWEGTGINDVEPAPDLATLPNGSTVGWFTSTDLRDYQFHRPRWGLAGSVDYRIKPGSTIFLRYLYSAYHDFGDKTVHTLYDNTPGVILLNPGNSGCTGPLDANGATSAPCDTAPIYYTQQEHIINTVGSVQLSGTHVLTHTWYSWSAAVGRGLQGGGWNSATYTSTLQNTSCRFNASATTNYHLPQWDQACFDEIAGPDHQVLNQVRHELHDSVQINIGVQGSGALLYSIGGRSSTFEYGAKFRSLHKYSDGYNAFATPTGIVPMSTFPNGLKDPHYYFNEYRMGYNALYGPVAKYIKQNPDQFSYTNDRWEDPTDYGLVEHIPAVYVMNTTDFRNGMRLVLGLRAEITTDSVHNLSFGNNGSVTPNAFSGSYYDLLPSASLRFHAGANSFLRLIYARGISRPEEQDLAQPLNWSVNGNAGNRFQVSFGNANLKAETGDDVDILYDHYFKTFGVLSAGYFYKRLGLPVVYTQTRLENYLPPGAPPVYRGSYLATEPINAGSAWISGIELQYLQHYSNLPGFLGGLGISSNYSYIGSRTSGIPGRSDRPRLLNNAPNMFNIGPTYDRGPLSMRMDVTFNQSNILAYQYTDGMPGGVDGPLSDVYFYDHTEVDAQGGFALHHGLRLIVSGRNLNDEVFGFYQGSKQYPIQREYYHPTFAVGLRWSPAER